MVNSREELDALLCYILDSDNVYYQPPANIRMSYPAIVYNISNMYDKHANNNGYIKHKTYQITHISNDPDSPVLDKLLDIPGSSYNRHYTSDNLYHDVFTITI